MYRIERIYLRFFRNYEQAEIFLNPKVNLIRGENAQGKTNLLEAIHLLSTGRSFRTTHLSEMIGYDRPFFYLEADTFKDGALQTIKLTFDGKEKKLECNNTSYSHFSNLLGMLPTVLFAPEDISLVSGSPAERRRFLDIHLAQIDPLYVYHLTRYHKAMKQRNHLLRLRSLGGIEAWEQMMLTAAAFIQQKRQEMVEAIAQPAASMLRRISSETDSLEISYKPSAAGDYLDSRSREMHFGTTLIGPHRDDISMFLEGKEARLFASQGQRRCMVAALKLAEWIHLRDAHGAFPILSVDDFGVHLDEKRSGQLLEMISDFGQVFLTSPYQIQKGVHQAFTVSCGNLR